MKDYTKGLKDISKEDLPLVGGKGANLGELMRLGMPVPNGFCVTTSAYWDFVFDLQDEIHSIVETFDTSDPRDINEKAERIRNIIMKKEFPKGMSGKIQKSLEKLMGRDIGVAVRSSATAEDLPHASFAGQHATYLNIKSVKDCLEKIKGCWASLWMPRAIHYREKHDFEHSKVGMGVVIQRMLSPSVSGVMFTRNSLSGNENEIVIEATLGLGEALVSGSVTPDRFIITKAGFEILNREIGEKEIKVIPSTKGVSKVSVPENVRLRPTLTDENIRKLSKMGIKIEKHFGSPQDIEWCLVEEEIRILQSRPATDTERELPILNKEELADLTGEWTKSPLDERVQEPLTPFTWSIAEESIPSFFVAMKTVGFHIPEDVEMVRLFYGRPYVNKTELERMFAALPGVVDDFIMGGQVHIDRRSIKPFMIPIAVRAFFLTFQVYKDWDRELPKILEHFAELRKFQVEKASEKEILDKLNEVIGIAHSVAATHALSLILCEALYQVLYMFVARYAGEYKDIITPRLVSGLPDNKTLETNCRLWRMARSIKESKFIRDCIQKGEWKDISESLRSTEKGRNFIENFNKFLRTYGHRSPRYDLMYPSWGDDPDAVLAIIRSYMTGQGDFDPLALERRSKIDRKKARQHVISRLDSKLVDRIFPVKKMFFRRLLGLSQRYMSLRENQQFYIGQGYPIARRMVLELGKRFAKRGVIDQPLDIFFLTMEEIRGTIVSKKKMNFHSEVKERKTRFESFKKIEAPPKITKDGASHWGAREVLSGVGGSPGTASGRVRIIKNIREFGRFKENEILCAPSTNPSWTPLFMMAKGVVTEVGGMLCHGAVVAREYGIPAVLGVKNATVMLKDGQMITIDGAKGIIYIKE